MFPYSEVDSYLPKSVITIKQDEMVNETSRIHTTWRGKGRGWGGTVCSHLLIHLASHLQAGLLVTHFTRH